MLVGAVHLVATAMGIALLASLSKFLLMPALWWYWRADSRHRAAGRAYGGIALALAFSWVGDVLLDLARYRVEGGERWFLSGIGAFFLAQLAYAVSFHWFPPRGKGLLWYRPWWLLVLLAYLVSFLWTLWPGLPQGLRIPVVVYGGALCTMVASAMNLGGRLAADAYRMVVWGALSFLLSDSLIGLSRFRAEVWSWPQPQVWIMLTYLAGQGLIVIGLHRALTRRSV